MNTTQTKGHEITKRLSCLEQKTIKGGPGPDPKPDDPPQPPPGTGTG